MSLRHLDLGFNELTSIPNEIGQLRNLEYLHLQHNQLTRIPSEIGQLIVLLSLHLNDNRLLSVPIEIFNSGFDVLVMDVETRSCIPSELLKSVTFVERTSTTVRGDRTEFGRA
jgi:Leucine-rich repeat (LRR) protein